MSPTRSTPSCGTIKSVLCESRPSSKHATTPRHSPTRSSASIMACVNYPSALLGVPSQLRATGCLTDVLALSVLPSAGTFAGHLPLSSVPASSEIACPRTTLALQDSPSIQMSFVRALARQRAGELMPVLPTTVLYRATLPLPRRSPSLAQRLCHWQSLSAFVLGLCAPVSIPPLTSKVLSIVMMKAPPSPPSRSLHAAPFLTRLRCRPRLLSLPKSTGLPSMTLKTTRKVHPPLVPATWRLRSCHQICKTSWSRLSPPLDSLFYLSHLLLASVVARPGPRLCHHRLTLHPLHPLPPILVPMAKTPST